MTDNTDPTKSPLKMDIPRKMSFTERLIGRFREDVQTYYLTQEKDDQMYGHGFNDSADEFVPVVMFNNAARRRTSSVSSTSSDASMDELGQGRQRTKSISEQVAGMQVIKEPIHTNDLNNPRLTTKPYNVHRVVGDIDDFSILI